MYASYSKLSRELNEMIITIIKKKKQTKHENSSRSSSSWVIDPNNNLADNFKTAYPTEISMPFLSFEQFTISCIYFNILGCRLFWDWHKIF